MKKQKVANLIMVILILVIAAAGVLTAGFIRGWFDHDAQAATLREIRGVVTMQRGGVAYPVDSDTVLRKGDTIVTSSRGTASIQIGESLISLNEKTELKVQESASPCTGQWDCHPRWPGYWVSFRNCWASSGP